MGSTSTVRGGVDTGLSVPWHPTGAPSPSKMRVQGAGAQPPGGGASLRWGPRLLSQELNFLSLPPGVRAEQPHQPCLLRSPEIRTHFPASPSGLKCEHRAGPRHLLTEAGKRTKRNPEGSLGPVSSSRVSVGRGRMGSREKGERGKVPGRWGEAPALLSAGSPRPAPGPGPSSSEKGSDPPPGAPRAGTGWAHGCRTLSLCPTGALVTPRKPLAPTSFSKLASHANVFRVHGISEVPICIYLDYFRRITENQSIWVDRCGKGCYLSVCLRNAMFSEWIAKAGIFGTDAACCWKSQSDGLALGLWVLRTAAGHPP